jgi:multiple sugar transport system permease protein
MIVTAMQTGADLFLWPPKFFPNFKELIVFKELFTTQPIGRWLFNSMIVGIFSAIASVILSIFCAYSLSRFRFRGSIFFSLLLVFTQMLPTVLLIVPLFIVFKQLHLLNRLLCLILANTAFIVPITVWILKSYFDTIPKEIEDAAFIDGCNRLEVLIHIILPLAKPAIVASLVIAFFEAWNEFAFAVTFIGDQNLWVASVGLASWIGWLTTPIEIMMAGATVFALPSIIFFLVLQKYLVSGLAAGAVKG